MAIATSTALLGLAAAGAVGGAVKGAQGTPNQTTTSTMGPMTDQQRQLQQESVNQYMKQLGLMDQYEAGIGSAQGIQDQARAGVSNIMSGQAMQLTPQEQQNIMGIRNAQISQGSADVNKLLDQRLQGLNQSAADRGVRGQALSQLQGDSLRAGTEQFGQIQRSADLQAAQSAMNSPYQRLAAQAPYLQQGMSFADQMRQQAEANRQTAQNPYMMSFLNSQRDGSKTQMGVPGDFWSGVSGAMAGGASGFGYGTQLAQSFRQQPAQTQTPTQNGGGGYKYIDPSQPWLGG